VRIVTIRFFVANIGFVGVHDKESSVPEVQRLSESKGSVMGLILAVLLLAILFGAVGFAVHALWIIAVIVLVAWVVGFLVRGGEGARWYRW
jgi:hypothetical protein